MYCTSKFVCLAAISPLYIIPPGVPLFEVIPFAHDTPLSVAYDAPTYGMVATVTHTGIEITSQLQHFTKFVQIDVLAVRSKTYIGQLCA